MEYGNSHVFAVPPVKYQPRMPAASYPDFDTDASHQAVDPAEMSGTETVFCSITNLPFS